MDRAEGAHVPADRRHRRGRDHSLPEQPGGPRNWDYRFCGLRDATFTLEALLAAGYVEEAKAWREGLLRAVAAIRARCRSCTASTGTRRLPEFELPWLTGTSVRDRFAWQRRGRFSCSSTSWGEVLDGLHLARQARISREDDAWDLQLALMEHLEGHWQEPDNGLWEIRGPRRHFTHSKVMAWVAADRMSRAVRDSGLPGPVRRWETLRDDIHADVLSRGYDAERGTFVQSYGSRSLDASLLLIPGLRFLPGTDPRVLGTIDAVQRELTVDGFVLRYRTDATDDGLPAEGVFLACSFWLVNALHCAGREDEAVSVRALLATPTTWSVSEEWDPAARRQLGNTPQALITSPGGAPSPPARGVRPSARADRPRPPEGTDTDGAGQRRSDDHPRSRGTTGARPLVRVRLVVGVGAGRGHGPVRAARWAVATTPIRGCCRADPLGAAAVPVTIVAVLSAGGRRRASAAARGADRPARGGRASRRRTLEWTRAAPRCAAVDRGGLIESSPSSSADRGPRAAPPPGAPADGLLLGSPPGGVRRPRDDGLRLRAVVRSRGDLAVVNELLLDRGWPCPAAHLAWTGVAAAALWQPPPPTGGRAQCCASSRRTSSSPCCTGWDGTRNAGWKQGSPSRACLAGLAWHRAAAVYGRRRDSGTGRPGVARRSHRAFSPCTQPWRGRTGSAADGCCRDSSLRRHPDDHHASPAVDIHA